MKTIKNELRIIFPLWFFTLCLSYFETQALNMRDLLLNAFPIHLIRWFFFSSFRSFLLAIFKLQPVHFDTKQFKEMI